ncbi:MAG: hypothetical protein EOP67_18455 [Sphingomonas sp.]|nr:MAG: hypothetical protein EOP67_18455 [Sphingomonas sp.]
MRHSIARCVPFALLVATSLSYSPFAAFAADPASSKTLDVLVECQNVTADMARLACFDAAARQIASARKSGSLLALDRATVVQRKQQRFGLADAAQNPLGGGEADQLTRVTEVKTTITGVKSSSYARFSIQLANNTVWETIEPLTLAPRPGTAIVIKQSGFGGFKASIPGERPILVKRQR